MTILLIDNGLIHPSLLARYHLRKVLNAIPGITMRRVSSLDQVESKILDNCQALVLYFHHKTISGKALDNLDAFIQKGGGLLALHSAAASFKQEPHYYDILGGRFISHGAVDWMKLEPTEENNTLFGRANSPLLIRDELYCHDYNPQNRIHFFTNVNGEQEPQVWTRLHGAGKVCYVAPGHCAGTFKNPLFQKIIQSGLTWAAGNTTG
jgi:uncharacterized protein